MMFSDFEGCIRKHPKAADRVIRELAKVLGVRVRRIRYAAMPDVAIEHPGAQCAFSPERREVYYWSSREEARIYLPHEIIHSMWPDPDPWDLTGPEHEWECGLIDYELGWLTKLCQSWQAKECLVGWSGYAYEGHSEDPATLKVSQAVVKAHSLVSPW
jgi:hypothetical protein